MLLHSTVYVYMYVYTHSVVLLLVLCLSLCVYIAVRMALCLPLSAQPSACLLGKPLTLHPLAMPTEALVSCPSSSSLCSILHRLSVCLYHTCVCTSLSLCCTYSIAHYRMFVNSADCTIVAAFICAGCIPCQLGPRPPCTAQRVPLCISVVCIIIYSFIIIIVYT